MADNNKPQDQSPPKPDPALKRLDRLVGTWIMMGRPVGSDKDSITGITGGWRPNPGADETVNAPYDITVSRAK